MFDFTLRPRRDQIAQEIRAAAVAGQWDRFHGLQALHADLTRQLDASCWEGSRQ